ncbi:MAG: YtxH domain-containing protein [Gemmatimonadota bacterium]|nr:YtxH domain-containing protein [Gemmatimonadota bacterium]
MWRDDEYEDEPYVVIERRSGGASSFLLGLAIGAGMALLLAPRSGQETRQEIGRRARRVKRAARDTAEEITDTVRDSYEHARRSVEDRIDAARSAIEIKKQQATEAIRAGREAAQQAREELERRIAETKAAYQAGADVARSGRPVVARDGGELSDDDGDATG